jgi:adenosine deaminase
MSAIYSNNFTQAKAELHLHLEGSLEPELMFNLAKRNNFNLPYTSVEQIKHAYQFNQLQDFLDIYYKGMSVLQTEQDYFDLTWAYLTKAHADGVTHSEMFFDPQAHLQRGISLSTIFNGITQAIQQASIEYNLQASLIPCFLRHLSEKNALNTFELLMNYRDKFIGIGLDSSELGNPPSKFKQLFNIARQEQLKLVAHAGEEGPAEYVWEALDILGVDRIDHGNAISTDPQLIKRIVTDKIPLTMCPLSNKCLNVTPDLREHQAKQLLDSGVIVTINSDDPAYFGGYVQQNYRELSENLALSDQELDQLCHNSLIAKFI